MFLEQEVLSPTPRPPSHSRSLSVFPLRLLSECLVSKMPNMRRLRLPSNSGSFWNTGVMSLLSVIPHSFIHPLSIYSIRYYRTSSMGQECVGPCPLRVCKSRCLVDIPSVYHYSLGPCPVVALAVGGGGVGKEHNQGEGVPCPGVSWDLQGGGAGSQKPQGVPWTGVG